MDQNIFALIAALPYNLGDEVGSLQFRNDLREGGHDAMNAALSRLERSALTAAENLAETAAKTGDDRMLAEAQQILVVVNRLQDLRNA